MNQKHRTAAENTDRLKLKSLFKHALLRIRCYSIVMGYFGQQSSLAPLTLFILLFLLPCVIGDLNSDAQALLNFSSSLPHSRRLNWSPSTPVCSAWMGVACDANQSRVISVRLPGVGLVGSIPPNTLGKLDALRVLSLRSNLLSGNLPSDISSLPYLHYLYLQQNNFSGSIPTSFSPGLGVLDLSFNSFTGNIPPELRNLTRLTGLNLQNNSLSGPIPDLNLPRLKHLNLSYNNLNGSIPSSLQIFPNSSFQGNSFLCGPPLLLQCIPTFPAPTTFSPPLAAPQPAPQIQLKSSKRKLSTAAIIAIAIGSCAVLFLLALVVLICCLKKKDGEGSAAAAKAKGSRGGRSEKPKEEYGSGAQEAEKNKLVFFEGCSFNFDLEDLLRASAEVLGKGSYGTAYKAVLEEGTTVVVKRLKEVVAGKREFEQQMEVVGRVGHHPNVVPLRAYYYSKDEKLLVYDYIPAGSLSALLHGTLVCFHPEFPVEILIALDVHGGLFVFMMNLFCTCHPEFPVEILTAGVFMAGCLFVFMMNFCPCIHTR
ncbi:hypothetical protein ACLOJK_012265 [Asimina triloba]